MPGGPSWRSRTQGCLVPAFPPVGGSTPEQPKAALRGLTGRRCSDRPGACHARAKPRRPVQRSRQLMPLPRGPS
eukprot:378626-Heterocapsa_arctica.AAC.1